MRFYLNKNLVIATLFLLFLPLAAKANVGLGKPNTAGSTALVIYNTDGAWDQEIAESGSTCLDDLLTSTGAAYNTGQGFNFTVTNLPVSPTFNNCACWATAASAIQSAVSASTILPLVNAATGNPNYCIIFDMRFLDYSNNTAPEDNPAGYVLGDTITQGDITAYQAYLAAGGSLFIMGDNYNPGGFITREYYMNNMINAVAKTGIGANSSNILSPGNDPDPANSLTTAPYNLNTNYNNLTGTSISTDFAGPIDGIGSGEAWVVMTSDNYPNDVLTTVWTGANDLQSAPVNYTKGSMMYWGDSNVLQAWATSGAGQAVVSEYMENAIAWLFNGNCCTPPSDLACPGGTAVTVTGGNPNLVSCFESGLNGWTGSGIGTGVWDGTQSFEASGGSDEMPVGTGTAWSNDNLFVSPTFAAGTLTPYEGICFEMKNTTNAAVSFQLFGTGIAYPPNITNPLGFTVPNNGTWTKFCLPFNGSQSVATNIYFVNETTGFTTGSIWLDSVQLQSGCNPNPMVADPSCCGAADTPTPTNTSTSTDTTTPTHTATNTPTVTDTNTPTKTTTNTDTATLTNTQTDTPTVTPSNTMTNTATLQNTATVTNTDTSSPTNTITNTDTPSVTDTMTNTMTNTATLQNTATVTNTDTLTMTSTVTDTSTPTVTATDTNTPTDTSTPVPNATFTNTSTVTDTNTVTNTYTVTDSATVTNTSTPTVTVTDTNTPSNTPTATNTFVAPNTNTATNTATQTATKTMTSTFTVTPTFTTFVAIGKTVSETEANAGDILTYNIAVTVTGSSLTSPVITDILPPNMTFQAFGNSPSGTTTSYSAATTQLQWNLPSTLAAGVYDLTYQTKVNTFAPANVPLVNHAQFTYAGLATPWSAFAPVTVIGNFTVSVDIYNSAGEVVKTIPIQSFSTAINNITLSTSNTITTLSGPGSVIYIMFNGVVIGTWDGTNSSGQPVGNGTYQIQITNVSNTGIATSVSQNAIVNRAVSSVTVDIFNSAGEAVRKLYNVMDNPTTSNMTNVTLSVYVLKLNASSSPSNAASSQLQIYVEDTNNPVTLVWDGTSDAGNFVTPGEYQIETHWTNGSGSTTDITRSVLVMPGTGISGIAVAEPNVLTTATGMNTTFNAMGVANAAGLKVKIYTVTGELVQSLTSGTPTAGWSATGLASGIYIANVEIDNASGGAINNQRLKILVLH